jgi:hypothetical protein
MGGDNKNTLTTYLIASPALALVAALELLDL